MCCAAPALYALSTSAMFNVVLLTAISEHRLPWLRIRALCSQAVRRYQCQIGGCGGGGGHAVEEGNERRPCEANGNGGGENSPPPFVSSIPSFLPSFFVSRCGRYISGASEAAAAAAVSSVPAASSLRRFPPGLDERRRRSADQGWIAVKPREFVF